MESAYRNPLSISKGADPLFFIKPWVTSQIGTKMHSLYFDYRGQIPSDSRYDPCAYWQEITVTFEKIYLKKLFFPRSSNFPFFTPYNHYFWTFFRFKKPGLFYFLFYTIIYKPKKKSKKCFSSNWSYLYILWCFRIIILPKILRWLQ